MCVDPATVERVRVAAAVSAICGGSGKEKSRESLFWATILPSLAASFVRGVAFIFEI